MMITQEQLFALPGFCDIMRELCAKVGPGAERMGYVYVSELEGGQGLRIQTAVTTSEGMKAALNATGRDASEWKLDSTLGEGTRILFWYDGAEATWIASGEWKPGRTNETTIIDERGGINAPGGDA